MPETKSKKYALRASIPNILRYAGLGGAVMAIIAVVIGFFIAGSKEEFRGKDFPGELSENVVGIIDKYNRKQTENGILKYHVTAEFAKTFDDNHQELDKITLKLFKDGDENRFDTISSDRAVYLPGENSSKFTVFFAGDVRIMTIDGLEVKTDQLNYRSVDGIARAEESVSFRGSNFRGRSFGAIVDIVRNTLELQRDIEIVTTKQDSIREEGIEQPEATRLTAGHAFFVGGIEKLKLRDKVLISIPGTDKNDRKQSTEIRSAAAEIDFVEKKIRRIELTGGVLIKELAKPGNSDSLEARARRAVALVDDQVEKLDLFDNVDLLLKRGNSDPISAKGDSAFFDREKARYELLGDVSITTTRDSLPLRAIGSKASYFEKSGVLELSEAAKVSQGGDSVRGDTIRAELTRNNRIRYAIAEGNGFLLQVTKERKTTISADKLRAWFAENELLAKSESRGNTIVNVTPVDQSDYSKLRISAKRGLDVAFNPNGSMKTMKTVGRTTLSMDAGSGPTAASEKTLTADLVTTVFRENGNELATATATGNPELVVVPRRDSAGVYRTNIRAPRFDCTFFPGNNAKSCESTKRSVVTRDAVRGKRPSQKLEADKLVTEFEPASRSINTFLASGDSRFSEEDRRAIAETIEFSQPDELVKLRGGNPTLWDSKGRAKAEKIDWNTRDDVSTLKGAVSTTYFNQKQTGGAAPFTDGNAPVYLTADSARFTHKERTALYIGDARAWQDDNYLRGDRILLEEASGRLYAEGNVRSVLYDAYRTIQGKRTRYPVFVSASNLLYRKEERQLRYEKNVDMRQGTDRILANEADVFLDSNNAITRSVIRGDVEITQPKKKATGDYAQYDAVSETMVLRGKPAVFSDDETGSSTGNIVTVNLKTNKVVNSGSSSVTASGRIRSVYKVKKGRLN